MMSCNRNIGSSLPMAMDNICENNENLQLPVPPHLAEWRTLMGLQAELEMDQKKVALKMKTMDAAQSMVHGASPLSPKNQQRKRPSSYLSQDEEDFLQKSAKRAKASHDAAMLLVMMQERAVPSAFGGMMHNPLLGAHLQPQLPLATPLMFDPNLLAASSGYAGAAAATQQLMLSQAFPNSNGANPLVRQHISSLINAELSRIAEAESGAAGGAARNLLAHRIQKRDPMGVAPPSMARNTVDNDNIACLNLGKEFLPSTTQCTRLCDCGLALCHEIGYPHKGSISFSAENVEEWCKTLDITDPVRLETIKANPEDFSLAYWHFRKQHQTVNNLTGHVTVWKSPRALPDAHLQSFVDEYKSVSNREEEPPRQPSKRMVALHNYWVAVRRAPAPLEP